MRIKKTIIGICLLTMVSSVQVLAATAQAESTSETAVSENPAESGIEMSMEDFQKTIIEETDLYGMFSTDQAFDLMKEKMNNGEDISLTDAFIMSGGLTIPDNFMYDLSESGLTGDLEETQLNFDYAGLVTRMETDYNALDLSSQSMDAVNYFNATYGNLAEQCRLGNVDFPEGFSLYSLVINNNQALSQAYSSVYSSENYANVRNSINVSSLFGQASKGISIPELKNAESLYGAVRSASSGQLAASQNKKGISQSQMQESIARYAESQMEIRTIVDSYTLDADGHIEYTDPESGETTLWGKTEEFEEVRVNNGIPAISLTLEAIGLNSKDNYQYINGDSPIGKQLFSGYTGEILYSATHGGNPDEICGKSMNLLEYLASGKIGDQIYDLLH